MTTETVLDDLERLLERVAREGTDTKLTAAWEEGQERGEVPISELEWKLFILDGCRSLPTEALVLVSELVEFLRPDKDKGAFLTAHVGEWLGDLGELLDPPDGEERFPELHGLTRFLHRLLVQPVEVRRAAIRMLAALAQPEAAAESETERPEVSPEERRVLEVLRHLEPQVRHEIVFGLGAVADGDMAPASRALALALDKEVARRRRQGQDVRRAEAGWERRRGKP